ncbi:MAG: outer membrane beta-barrel protein, partial [Muribaculaceae bacterium]|nr:outer membrane beta-barrel protein [Muribaculaceae bacterium]
MFWLLLPEVLWGNIVTGHVVDTDNMPIEFANVVVMKDTTFITGSTTDAYGLFTIDDARGANNVLISKTGYESVELPLNHSTDLGKVIMKQTSLLLNEVVVTRNLPITQLKGNTLVTKVQNSVLSKMGNAYDVLTHTPMVTGINGELNVLGRGIPTVYINGREVRNQSDLQQLKSEDIQSVELITNPGASYSSEINSVIKIKTRPPKGDGFSLDVSEKATMWSYVRNSIDLNLRYKHNGLEIFGDIDLYDGKRKYDDINEMTTYSKDTFFQSLCNTSVLTTHSIFGKLGFSYSISDNHSFGAYFQLGQSKSHNEGHLDSESNMFRDDKVAQLENISSTYNTSSRYFPSQEANAYYNGSFGKLSIDFNADYLQSRNATNEVRQDYSMGSDLKDINVISDGVTKNRLIAEKFIVSYPVWKGDIEVGEEYTGSKLSYNYVYEGALIDNSLTDISENNFAAFANLSQAFGKWNISIGLRYEHADFVYSDELLPEKSLSRKYSNMFPSLSVSTKIGKVRLSL